MATGYVAPTGKFIVFYADGRPLAGGKVWTYQAGTSTPTPTWSDAALTVPNTNPVILDAAGRASIRIADASVMTYKWVVQDANGVEQYTEDGISIPAGATAQTPVAVPAGTILPYGGPSAPTDNEPDGRKKYLLCNGQSVSTGTYGALWAVIGYTFGGATGLFNVPDMRGRFPLGVAVSGTGSTLAQTGGQLGHQHDMPSHVHSIADHLHAMPHQHNIVHDGWPAGTSGTPENTPPVGTLLVTQTGTPYAETARGDKNTADPTNINTALATGLVTGVPTVLPVKVTAADPAYIALNFIIKT